MIKKYLLILTTIFIAFNLSACSSKKVINIKQKELPSWYQNPKITNSTTLYALGEGKTEKDALMNALNNIASQLSVSISSSFESTIKTSNTTYSNNASQTIKSKVDTIKINNYKLLKHEKIKYNLYVVAISSNKLKLFNTFKQELDTEMEIITTKIASIKDKISFEKYLLYKKLISKNSIFINKLSILNVLNNNFDDTKYKEYLKNIITKYQLAKNSIVFTISCSDSEKEIKELIKNALTKQGFSIIKQQTNNSINIFISSNINESKSMGFVIVNRLISFDIKHNSTSIASNSINIKATTSQNRSATINKTILKFKQKIKDDGINSILGL